MSSFPLPDVVQRLQSLNEIYAGSVAAGLPADELQLMVRQNQELQQNGQAALSQELQGATLATTSVFHQHCTALINASNRVEAVMHQRVLAPQSLFQTAIGRLTTDIQTLSQKIDRLAVGQPLSPGERNQLHQDYEHILLQLNLLHPYADHSIREEYTRMIGAWTPVLNKARPFLETSGPSIFGMISSGKALLDAIPLPIKVLMLSFGLYRGYQTLSLFGAAMVGMSEAYNRLVMPSSLLPPPSFGEGLSSAIARLHADIGVHGSSSPSEAESLRLRDRFNALLGRARGERVSDTDRNTLSACSNSIIAWRQGVRPPTVAVRSQPSTLASEIESLHRDIRAHGSSSPSDAESLRLRDRFNALLGRVRGGERVSDTDQNTLCETCLNQIMVWRRAATVVRSVPVVNPPVVRSVPVVNPPVSTPVRTIRGTVAAPLAGGDQRIAASSTLQAANFLATFFQDSQLTPARIGAAVKEANDGIYPRMGSATALQSLVRGVGFITLQQMKTHNDNDPVALQAPATRPASLASCQQLLLEISTGVRAERASGAVLTKGERALSIVYQNGPGQPKFVLFDPSTLSAHEFTDRDVAARFLQGLLAQMPSSSGEITVSKANKAVPIDPITLEPIPEERQITVNGKIVDIQSLIPFIVVQLKGKDTDGTPITSEEYRVIFRRISEYLGVSVQAIFDAFIENASLPFIPQYQILTGDGVGNPFQAFVRGERESAVQESYQRGLHQLATAVNASSRRNDRHVLRTDEERLQYLSLVAAGHACANREGLAIYRNAAHRASSVNAEGTRIRPGRAERFITLLGQSRLPAAKRDEMIQELTPSTTSRPPQEAVVIPDDAADLAQPLLQFFGFGQGLMGVPPMMPMMPIVAGRRPFSVFDLLQDP